MAVEIPKGIVKLPWSLTRETTGVSLYDSVADTWSPILEYQVPRNTSIAVKTGDRFALYLRTAVPADITAGMVRLIIADANKMVRYTVLEAPLKALMAGSSGGTFNVDDREKMFFMPAGFSREADEWIIIEFKGADVADDAQTQVLLEGTQFIKV